METVRIFISYAKKDYNMMRAVAACCKKINQIDFGGTQYKVEVWSDDDMIPGERWNPQIEDNIKDADVVLFS